MDIEQLSWSLISQVSPLFCRKERTIWCSIHHVPKVDGPCATPCKSWSAPQKWPGEKWRWTAKVNFPVHVSSLFISSVAPPPATHVRCPFPHAHVGSWANFAYRINFWLRGAASSLYALVREGHLQKKGFFLRRGGAIFSGIDFKLKTGCSAHVSAPEKGRIWTKMRFF